jgi:hypothetical protein
MNSLRHGLTAKQTVVGDEDPEEFDAFHSGLVHDLEPICSFQQSLVLLIAKDLWRLQRIGRLEAGLIRKELGAAEADHRRYRSSQGSGIQNLREKIDAISRRMMLSGSDGNHVREHSQDELAPIEKVDARDAPIENTDEVAKLPEEARQQCQDQAFTTILSDNRMMTLSRYEAGLVKGLVLKIRLLQLAQTFRAKGEDDSSVIDLARRVR